MLLVVMFRLNTINLKNYWNMIRTELLKNFWKEQLEILRKKATVGIYKYMI